MKHKYVDITSNIQVLGCVYQNPDLLDHDAYFFSEEDFIEDIHEVLFGTIFDLHSLGAKTININTIEDYLAKHPKQEAIYIANNGAELLQKLEELTSLSTFDFYYHRMKKMTLLRVYNEWCGMDLNWLYNPDELNVKKKEIQQDWFDNATEEEIGDLITERFEKVNNRLIPEKAGATITAGQGIEELLQRLKDFPEIGCPLYGNIFNTILRGARLKKFYLRSAETGLGKTRSMIADVCTLGCSELYNKETGLWEKNGSREPVMYISTEQEFDEIQTMLLAFIANVNEAHILYNEYVSDEWDRVCYAAKILKECDNIHLKSLSDFNLTDIEDTVRSGVRDYGVRYVFHDYIHSSMKILGEVAGKAKVKGLREDNVLFMISVRLKDLCNELGIFLMSATQLSNDYHTAKVFDQGLLQGAKAIANKVDVGMIMLYTTEEDKEALKELVESNGFEMPTIKVSVYKNRRGQYNRLFVWCKEDRGVCRIDPLFCTNYNLELRDDIIPLKIKVEDKSE